MEDFVVWEQLKENITKQGVQNHCQYEDTVYGVTAEKAFLAVSGCF